MDVSNQKEGLQIEEQKGTELISTVISATGLPSPLMEDELQGILKTTGVEPADLTMDQLRSAMIAYLESVHRDFSEEAEDQTKM